MKIYLYPKLDSLPNSFLLSLLSSKEKKFGPLFQNIETSSFKKMVTFVDNVNHADYIMLPHNFSQILSKNPIFLKQAEQFSSKNSKKTIVFEYSDSHKKIDFPNSIILRSASYRSRIQSSEYIIPAFVEDLGDQFGWSPISKAAKPIIGFSGMTNLPNLQAEFRYRLKLLQSRLKEKLGSASAFERQGLYFRRLCLKELDDSPQCELKVKKRNSFSAARSTIQGDPHMIRNEFVESIKNSHLPLVVRGNGNYSLRFFEVLSLGRVPLFIDTDTPLPLEDEIDYDSFMLRVDYKNIDRLPYIIDDFWRSTSEQKFIDMQKQARKIFETKLKADAFYRHLFSNKL